MKLENQITSLELSKKLKEFGTPQNSLFYWVISSTTNYHLSYTEGDKDLLPQDRNDFYSAFTVAELGNLLPEYVKGCWLRIVKNIEKQWGVCYYKNNEIEFAFTWFDSLSEAMGKMLIYLLENKLILL